MPRVRDVVNRTVLVSALGYFVDIYDLLLFSIVRTASLVDLGYEEGSTRLLDAGILLLNFQMAGLLVGGVLWGVLGDRRGRVSVLFGSILLYSLANVANAFVVDLPTYAALRFLAGVGLAGELGAAITLVSEVMPKETRGYGTAIVASVGVSGAVLAALVGNAFSWQTAYLVGGGLGLVLLVARWSLHDSAMWAALTKRTSRRGDLRLLFTNRERFGRYAYSLLAGLPIWFVVGILITFSPELGRELGVAGAVVAGTAVLWNYVGLVVGDFASGFLAQGLRSRKNILIAFITLTSALIFVYVFSRGLGLEGFYALCFFLGVGIGYWAVFITNAAEQFGTNVRATVATTAPNFVRGTVVPITLTFRLLAEHVSLLTAAMLVGQATVLVALFSVRRLEETYGKDLDYVEEDAAPVAPARGAIAARG